MIKSYPVYSLEYVAVCEHCRIEGPASISEAGAIKQAKKHGWKLILDDWYCPEHTESPLIAEKQIRLRDEAWIATTEHIKEFIEKQEHKQPKTEE